MTASLTKEIPMLHFLTRLLGARSKSSPSAATGLRARRQRKPVGAPDVAELDSRIVPSVVMQGNDLLVVGTPRDDQIAIEPCGDGTVQALIGGVAQGCYSPTGRIIVIGRAGGDHIQVAPRISLSAWLDG